MKQDLVFYTHPMSRSRVVRWMLEEVGQPYQTRCIEFGEEMKGPDYRAINPMGKVPALTHGDTVITEGAAICAYLADAFPEADLAPSLHSPERGSYYRWLFFIAGPLDAATTDKALGLELGDDPQRSRMAGYGTLTQVLDTLETELENKDYLVGGRFTAADLYAGAYLAYYMSIGLVDPRPAFERYVARLTQRPAAIKANEIDNALAAAQA